MLRNLSLQYHVAAKKIPIADEQGNTKKPTSNTGIKLEAFIFDTFPLSSRMAVLAVPRETEFAPVKNAPGNVVDSPDTARQMIFKEARRWLTTAAHATLETKQASHLIADTLKAATTLEISPLVSYHGEGLETVVQAMKTAPQRSCIHIEAE